MYPDFDPTSSTAEVISLFALWSKYSLLVSSKVMYSGCSWSHLTRLSRGGDREISQWIAPILNPELYFEPTVSHNSLFKPAPSNVDTSAPLTKICRGTQVFASQLSPLSDSLSGGP
uniref:Uncharacterized protein n=1 Tax=Hyaloperonospora arabidopsidis (strain Emoy2) TaxID=559515 RepID=M4BU71_HYAAE